MTVNEAYAQLVSHLTPMYAHEESVSITAIVLCDVLKCSHAQLRSSMEKLLSHQNITVLEGYTQRLLASEPVQYVVGYTYFDDCVIKVNSEVLIPRPETEELVYIIAKRHQGVHPKKIVDVCTGSGCIAIALKRKFSDAYVLGVDISPQAVSIAKENAVRNNIVAMFCIDDVLASTPKEYFAADMIVANPPYVSADDKLSMHSNVLQYEPHAALFPHGNDVLIFYKAIAGHAQKYLRPMGVLYFEINEKYGHAVAAILAQENFNDIEIIKDMFGKNRFARGVKK